VVVRGCEGELAVRGDPYDAFGQREASLRQIVDCLRARRSEILDALQARVLEVVPEPACEHDEAYLEGMRAAIAAVFDYGLEAIESGELPSRPVPGEARSQARWAARNGVSLGVVVRRCVACHGELGDLVMREALRNGLWSDGPALHHIRRVQEALLERLITAVESEYQKEHTQTASPGGLRKLEIVQRLLCGGSPDPAAIAELNYEIDRSWHLGLVATGSRTEEFIRRLKMRHAGTLLAVSLDSNVWAWLGAPTRALVAGIAVEREVGLAVAIGEPCRGLEGWRLTHDQADGTLRIALQTEGQIARYADDRLLAAAVASNTLVRSLKQRYLVPLRSYIDAECNATSAAHALKVERRTVNNRVRTAEHLIGCAFRECMTELDVALRLEEFDGHRVE
jgi:hypothetical protein